MKKIALWSRNTRTGLPYKRNNSLLPVEHYEIIKNFIVSVFVEERSLTLSELLQKSSCPTLPISNVPSLSTKVLMVKNDLEARDLLMLSFDLDHTQTIRLKKRIKKSVRYV